MTQIDAFQLHKMIPHEEFDYTLLSSVLSEYSAIRQKINELLKAGIIVRVKKGLYVFGPHYNQIPVCKETLANLIYGPSYISLEYALAYHGLIPERVETVTSVTSKRDKEFNTPLGRFTYRFLGINKYPHEIHQVWIDRHHPVWMASPEKALCDYLVLNKVNLEDLDPIQDFLEGDLRIDRKNWQQLNPNTLKNLNKIYRNENIKSILEAL
jgi:predicted transcriptional regulator of viral defense system